MKGGENMNNKIILGIIVVAILGILGYFAYSNTPIVSAEGSSSLKAQPDELSVYINIETRNATLQDAQKTNSQISANVMSALTALDIDEKDIQFAGYSSYPWNEWDGTMSKDKGFIVSQQIIVKTAKFSDTPKIVDAAVNSRALVQSIQFELSESKQNDYKSQALKAASENAKEKASSIAEGQNRELGRLVSVQSNDFNYYPMPYYTMKDSLGGSASASVAEARSAAANIAPSDIDVSASVTVQYKLSIF